MFDLNNRNEGRRKGALGSLLVHLGMAGLVLAAGTSPVVKQITHDSITIFAPAFKPLPQAKVSGGGGGGGDRSKTPPDQGVLPRLAPKTFVPPAQVVRNLDPKLAVPPAIDLAQDLHVTSNLQQYGNPMDGRALPSNGPGNGGGIGTGAGGGIGSGNGNGLGAGSYGNFGGGVYQIGGGVSQPVPIYRPDPDYPEEARKSRFQGTVMLSIVVDAAGNVSHVQVTRPMGMGLDEKAIEAVKKWRFKPGMRNGQPVPVVANIELSFRLL